MRAVVVLFSLVWLAGCRPNAAPASGQPSGPAAGDTAAVRAAKQGWMVDAYLRPDPELFTRLTAPEFTLVAQDGNLYDRQHEIDVLRKGRFEPPTVTYALSDQHVRFYGHVAVVTGVFTGLDNGRPALRMRYSNSYLRRDGAWIAVAAHFTRIGDS